MAPANQQYLWGSASLDPRLEGYFRPLCTPTNEQELSALITEISDHVEEIKQALQHNEFLDIDTAERLASTLLILLEETNLYSDQNQILIVGAARYFVHPHDADPDTGSMLGLDDDTAVLNYVLETIGKPELKIDL